VEEVARRRAAVEEGARRRAAVEEGAQLQEVATAVIHLAAAVMAAHQPAVEVAALGCRVRIDRSSCSPPEPRR
jgi:hypothetical protein